MVQLRHAEKINRNVGAYIRVLCSTLDVMWWFFEQVNLAILLKQKHLRPYRKYRLLTFEIAPLIL